MDLEQIKALKKDANSTLLDLTAVTYKDSKEQANWIEFLKSGIFTYKYPFTEQLQIHAQTKSNDIRLRAVADLEIWNKFGYRLKDSEAKAISIMDLDNIVAKTNQKQVYDISQLERKDGRDEEIPFKLWDKDITLDKADRLKTVLIEKYNLKSSTDNELSLSSVLFFCLEEKFKRILDENQNKFAVGENISDCTYGEIGFTAFVSAQIMLIARLGTKAGFSNEDATSFYKMIYDYLPRINTKDTITALGEMTNTFAREMFSEIEIEVKKIERGLKNASKGELNHEQINLDGVGKNASGISEGIQPNAVSEVGGTGGTTDPLHRDTEPNAGLHRENEEPNIGVSSGDGENAEQSGKSDGMDTGDELHRADGDRNSNQGNDREPLVDEKEENAVDASVDKKVLITNINAYDHDIYGNPWVCAVSRGKNYFTTKEGEPVGEYTGNEVDGGSLYVINPQEGRIYGYGQKNKEDNSKSLTAYAKYQSGNFLLCDRNGNLLEVEKVVTHAAAHKSETLEPVEEPKPITEKNEEIEETLETAEQTEPIAEPHSPQKSEWELYIEKRTTGIFAKQYKEPIVLIEFSENPNFGGANSPNFQGYEELTFTQADRKFKEVEADARAERIRENGELGGYDKAYGVILYKDSPNDTELSTYGFRYDIGDYDEEQSGLFNHINNFWNYQEKAVSQGTFTGYKQENVDNAKRMLAILEPYSAKTRSTRLKEYFEKFPTHQETRPVGEKVLLPLLFEGSNLNRDGKRTYVTIEEPIGKYQIYSGSGNNDSEKYAYVMTPSSNLINIAMLSQIKSEHVNKAQIERLIDERIILGNIDLYEKNAQDPTAFIDYHAAAVLNCVEEAITHNDPIMESKRRQQEEKNKEHEEQRKQEEKRIAEEKAEHENLGGFGDDGSMTPLQKSKTVAFLKDEQYVTKAYGALSNKEFVEKVVSEGYMPKKRVSLKKKYADMAIGDSQDGSNFSERIEIQIKLRQIRQDNLGLESPQAKWLKEHSILTYYKTFKNKGLDELAKMSKNFLESPEMKPFVNTEYAFSKPLEQDGHYSTYSQGIAKTHFDYGEFLLKVNPVIREKNAEIEDAAKDQEINEIQEPQKSQEPLKPEEVPQKNTALPSSGIFAALPERHIKADVKGTYSDTHFRIGKNGYDSSGRTEWNESTRKAYENEVAEILTAHGWSIQKSNRNGASFTATKGKNHLYLHPQDFSGVCENSEREMLFEAFKNADTFVCGTVDVYREIYDMTDEELTEKLNNEKETIENELIEAFTTKRSNLYTTSVGYFGVDGNIGKRHSIKRLAIEGEENSFGVDRRTDGICTTFAGDIFKSLVDSGKIVSSKTKNGIGYRSANKDELNQLQLSYFTFDKPEEAHEVDSKTTPKATEQMSQSLEEKIRSDLSSRGFAVSDELIADGITDSRTHGVPLTSDDITDFIENEYLTEEPERSTGTAEILAESNNTPLLQGNSKWQEYKALETEHSDKIIFIQLGDFYEVLGDKAIDVAKVLNINSTSRDVGLPERVPMCGIPNFKLEEYSELLIKNGYSVVVKNNDGLVDIRLSELEEAQNPHVQTDDVGIVSEEAEHNTIEETEKSIAPEPPQNYRLNEQTLNRTSFGEKSRYKDNIQAIKTLKLLESESRKATADEQEILSQYAGWGGISQAFNAVNSSWNNEYTELKELLTDQEYREAQSSTLSAFYTNPTIIKAMYEALESMEITSQINETDKLNILEPSLGVGNFFGVMPEKLQQKASLHGVELDSISARIAQNLYPQANIQNTGYEETYAKDYFDIILGNVPFGDFKLIDKQNPEISQQNFRIHDHFFAKALDQVRPGGVVAFITSSGTMDKETTKTRRYIAERAELLGAIRLPNNAFKSIANTEVTSDIIFLQRRAEPLNLSKIKEQAEREGKDGEEAIKQLCPWIFTEKVSGINKVNGEDVPINSYFINNPQMVLGEMILDNGNRMHGALIPTCKPFEDMDLSEQLKTAITELKPTEPIKVPTQGYVGTFEVYEGLNSQDQNQEQSQEPIIRTIPRNFSFVLGNENSPAKGKVYFFEVMGKQLEDVTDTLSDLQKERMAGLIGIKDTCRALIDAQLNNHSDETIKGLQGELNSRYDEYTKTHGLINGRVVKQLFSEDSSYPLLCALEVLDTNGEFIRKSDMFFKRTINPIIEITNADTAEEALILSMSERGFVDVAYMEKLTGRTENELFSELIGLGKVYKDLRYTVGTGSYEYRTVDDYLSGNVRTKLSKAESLLGELKELSKTEEMAFSADPQTRMKNKQIQYLAEVFDADEKLLRAFSESTVTEGNINEYGRLNELLGTVNKLKAKTYFDKTEGQDIQTFRINVMTSNLFREFLLNGVLDIGIEAESADHDIADYSDAKTEKYAEILANTETVKYNIAALEKSIPKQLESSDIDVRFGSTWIPPHYIGDFIAEKLQLSRYTKDGIGMTYDKHTSTWGKKQSYTHVDRVLSTEVYGTKRIEAMDIMLDTLNLKDVKIYDPHPDDSKRRILNYKETVLAQDKQKKIKKEFIDWIWDNADRRADLVEIYNRQFNAIRPREYDGSNLRFTGMSPEIKMKPHQKDAVARILYGGNTLLAHEVGLGKTFEMIAAAMESKRLGLCNKSLITVPKHLTEQFGADFLKVYPNANVLIVRENDFTPQNRKKFCAKIAVGDYDAIIMAHSQFEKIPLSKERQEQFIQDQIDELEYERDAESGKHSSDRNQFTVKQLEKRKKQLESKLDDLINQEYKDDTINFEELGIGKLFVDEAHFFKNLYFSTKLTNVAGLSKSESNRATDMFMKCRYLDEKTGNKGVCFATGTPVSNSLAEMYTMQRFLQFDTLEEHGLYSFDDWASSFGDIVTSYEIAPEGNGKYRERRRFAEFFNLPELMNIFTQAADIKTSDTVDIPRPIAHRHTVVAQPDEITKQYIQSLSERAEAVQQKRVRPEQDNMLSITNDGRKIGLDPRLMNNLLPDNPTSKLNTCVQNVFDIWNDTKVDKLTQLLFCDLSTPKSGKDAGFNIYDDVREKLVAKGIPREQIKFIHEAKNDAQKKVLFEKVRNGEVRVLLGSTEKLGSGTNVQNRLIALHNLDCPWRPSDLEQRVGRILRQGNDNKEIHIYNYVTENTFDAYLYQTIENKQKFVSQIMTNKEIARRFSDIDEAVLNYAEIKALCTGNPLIKVKLDLEREIGNLEIMRKSHTMQRHRLEDMVKTKGPEQLLRNKNHADSIRKDLEILKQNPLNKEDKENSPPFTIDGKVYTEKKEAGAALMAACQKQTGAMGNSKIGSYRGFEIYARYSFTNSNYELTLKNNHSYTISTGNSADGNLTRINNALSEVFLIETLEKFEGNVKNTEQEIATAEEQLKHSFPQESEYQEKLTRLEEINKELGIGLDEELEQAEKSEAATVEANKDGEIKEFEGWKPIDERNTDMDVGDDYDENEYDTDDIPQTEVKRKKAYELAM